MQCLDIYTHIAKVQKVCPGLKHQIRDTGSFGGGRGKEKREERRALQLSWYDRYLGI